VLGDAPLRLRREIAQRDPGVLRVRRPDAHGLRRAQQAARDPARVVEGGGGRAEAPRLDERLARVGQHAPEARRAHAHGRAVGLVAPAAPGGGRGRGRRRRRRAGRGRRRGHGRGRGHGRRRRGGGGRRDRRRRRRTRALAADDRADPRDEDGEVRRLPVEERRRPGFVPFRDLAQHVVAREQRVHVGRPEDDLPLLRRDEEVFHHVGDLDRRPEPDDARRALHGVRRAHQRLEPRGVAGCLLEREQPLVEGLRVGLHLHAEEVEQRHAAEIVGRGAHVRLRARPSNSRAGSRRAATPPAKGTTPSVKCTDAFATVTWDGATDDASNRCTS
jgi:hypothetical protein